MKFSPGDKVIVHKPKEESRPHWNLKMDEFDGVILTLDSFTNYWWNVKENRWGYAESWLELVPVSTEPRIYKFSECKQWLKKGMSVAVTGKYKCHKAERVVGKITQYMDVNYSDGINSTGGLHGLKDDDTLQILTNPDGSKWEEPLEPKDPPFRIGDKVRLKQKESYDKDIYAIRTVLQMIDLSGCPDFCKGQAEGKPAHSKDCYPLCINPEEHMGENNHFYYKSLRTKTMGKILDVVEKIKNFKLSKVDKVLRANGLEDEHGKPTQLAKDMMMDELALDRWILRAEEVAKELIAIEEER